jgi:hypothetical protein
VIIAGAALPGQDGNGHVNEQWVDYWVTLFGERGFKPFDFLRPMIWDDDRIEPWYRQNTVGFFRNEPPARLVEAAEQAALKRLRKPDRLVHPSLWVRKADNSAWPLSKRLVKRLIGRYVL